MGSGNGGLIAQFTCRLRPLSRRAWWTVAIWWWPTSRWTTSQTFSACSSPMLPQLRRTWTSCWRKLCASAMNSNKDATLGLMTSPFTQKWLTNYVFSILSIVFNYLSCKRYFPVVPMGLVYQSQSADEEQIDGIVLFLEVWFRFIICMYARTIVSVSKCLLTDCCISLRWLVFVSPSVNWIRDGHPTRGMINMISRKVATMKYYDPWFTAWPCL